MTYVIVQNPTTKAAMNPFESTKRKRVINHQKYNQIKTPKVLA